MRRAFVVVPLIVAAICSRSTAIEAQPTTKTTIFVGPQIREGFVDTDRGVMDSIKVVPPHFARAQRRFAL